jgi:hypothetical protein
MFTIPFLAVIVYAILYALWKLQRQFCITKLALDNIPGPPSQSLLFGEFFEPLIFETVISSFIHFPGVFPQLFNIKGWEFHKYIEQKCMNFFFDPLDLYQ